MLDANWIKLQSSVDDSSYDMIFSLEAGETYYIRFKSVLEEEAKEFYMDYFEYVPKEVYDNPEESEDIW